MKYLIRLKELVLDLLFPPLCLHCQTHISKQEKDAWLCHTCENHILIYTTIFCSVCGARLPENKKVCHKSSSYLLAAATKYDGPIRSVIRQFKYYGWPSLSKKIGKYLEKYIKTSGFSAKNYIVVPIPLHAQKLKERGFNQAELLSVEIAKLLGLKINKEALMRTKKTSAQAELKDYAQDRYYIVEKRKNNIAEAFRVENADQIAGKNLILVDDVFTSGATMNEAVRVLRSAGAKKIVAFVIAKTK